MHHFAVQTQKNALAYGCVRWLTAFASCCLISLTLSAKGQVEQPRAANTLRIGLLTAAGANPEAASIKRGVQLGAAEARQTAGLFGNDVQLFDAIVGKDAIGAATRLLSRRQVQVLIGASPTDADKLSSFAQQRHIVFLNVASRSQALRTACRRFTFHVEASEAMYAGAALLGRQSAPRPTPTSSLATARDSIVLWGATLERYGASQINDRYRGKYHVGMDGGAWAGWFAVKLISESALRARSVEPTKLLAYLEMPSTSFDGHKGWPLSFRRADHQLREPLYIMLGAASPAGAPKYRDVPELRGNPSPNGSDDPARLNHALDRLIASPTAPRCQWDAR